MLPGCSRFSSEHRSELVGRWIFLVFWAFPGLHLSCWFQKTDLWTQLSSRMHGDPSTHVSHPGAHLLHVKLLEYLLLTPCKEVRALEPTR